MSPHAAAGMAAERRAEAERAYSQAPTVPRSRQRLA